MTYLADHRADKRVSIQTLFPLAETLLVVAWPYRPPSPNQAIAAYAHTTPDYHKVIPNKLSQVLEELKVHHPDLQGWPFADIFPVLERGYAAESGMGWVGKNTCVIDRKQGSYFTLGGMALSIPMDHYTDTQSKNYCGSCSACISACPTQAFVSPYVLDARKCISYLTIEYRGIIEKSFFPALKGHFFGCDICQQVCPWNKKHVSNEPESFDAKQWLTLTRREFNEAVKDTALNRLRYNMMQRNALIQLVHSIGLSESIKWLESEKPLTDLAQAQLQELLK